MSPIPFQSKILNFIILLVTLSLAYLLSKNLLSFIIISLILYLPIYIVFIKIYHYYQGKISIKSYKQFKEKYMDNFPNYRDEFELLMQTYLELENKYAKISNYSEEYKLFREKLDKQFEKFDNSYYRQNTNNFVDSKDNKEDKWLFYALKNANKSRHGMEATFSYMYDHMIEEDAIEKFRLNGPKTLSFYKENNIWYIDLPEFLKAGLGTKANLMMVAGADTLLDKLSKNGQKITLQISNCSFPGFTTWLEIEKQGKDDIYLQEIGHAPVDNGAYYKTILIENIKETNSVWLCPVTEYVFEGYYPKNIYIKILTN